MKVALAALGIMTVIGGCTSPTEPTALAAPAVAAAPAPAACDVSRITVKSINARFENVCRRRECMYLQGAATLVNGCAVPIGIQIQVIGLDASGDAIASKDLWPASTRNLPPGENVISLEQALDYQPGMASIRVQAIDTRQW